jgi:hypothetical protein
MKTMDQKMIPLQMNKVTKSSFQKNRKKGRKKDKILRLLSKINRYLNLPKKMYRALSIPIQYTTQQLII